MVQKVQGGTIHEPVSESDTISERCNAKKSTPYGGMCPHRRITPPLVFLRSTLTDNNFPSWTLQFPQSLSKPPYLLSYTHPPCTPPLFRPLCHALCGLTATLDLSSILLAAARAKCQQTPQRRRKTTGLVPCAESIGSSGWLTDCWTLFPHAAKPQRFGTWAEHWRQMPAPTGLAV